MIALAIDGEMLAEMTVSLDRLKASFATTPAGYPLREQVVAAIAKAHGWLVGAEDQARHLSYTVGNPSMLATFKSVELLP